MPERLPSRQALSGPVAMPTQASNGQRHLASSPERAACLLAQDLPGARTQAGLGCLCLRMPAQAFAPLHQAESHHPHAGHGRPPPRRTVPWEAFRPQPCLDRLMLCLHHPACGIWQSPGARLGAVGHFGLTQQEPCQPVGRVGGGDVPDTHGSAWEGARAAPPLTWTPGSTARHGGGTHAPVCRARRVWRPLASLSGQLAPRDGAACRGASSSRTRPRLWMASGTLCGRVPDHPVAECLPTHSVGGPIRFAVGAPAPPPACRGTPHAVTGGGPDGGRARAFAPLV